jgi:hypothetical protein
LPFSRIAHVAAGVAGTAPFFAGAQECGIP